MFIIYGESTCIKIGDWELDTCTNFLSVIAKSFQVYYKNTRETINLKALSCLSFLLACCTFWHVVAIQNLGLGKGTEAIVEIA
jgi:hypothetical protein